jgi:hypothetical protein
MELKHLYKNEPIELVLRVRIIERIAEINKFRRKIL